MGPASSQTYGCGGLQAWRENPFTSTSMCVTGVMLTFFKIGLAVLRRSLEEDRSMLATCSVKSLQPARLQHRSLIFALCKTPKSKVGVRFDEVSHEYSCLFASRGKGTPMHVLARMTDDVRNGGKEGGKAKATL